MLLSHTAAGAKKLEQTSIRLVQDSTPKITDWKQGACYDHEQAAMESAWRGVLWPLISDCDFSIVVDLACGHGRSSEMLRRHGDRIYLADVNQKNLDFCRARFGGDPGFRYILCDGPMLPQIPDKSVTLLYCFNAMVYYDSDLIRAWLKEFHRILRPGGRGLCHHSNYTGNPAGEPRENPYRRTFMSREMFEYFCREEGFRMIRSQLLDWGGDRISSPGEETTVCPALDCISLFEVI